MMTMNTLTHDQHSCMHYWTVSMDDDTVAANFVLIWHVGGMRRTAKCVRTRSNGLPRYWLAVELVGISVIVGRVLPGRDDTSSELRIVVVICLWHALDPPSWCAMHKMTMVRAKGRPTQLQWKPT